MYKIVGIKRKELYQWDRNIRIKIDEDLDNIQLHAANDKEVAIPLERLDDSFLIPDEFTQTGRPLDFFVYKIIDGQFYTTKWFTIPVVKRARPENY